jgi:hypothetical protein
MGEGGIAQAQIIVRREPLPMGNSVGYLSPKLAGSGRRVQPGKGSLWAVARGYARA